MNENKPQNKYRAQKVQTQDGTFDSRKEYKRWCELNLLLRAGVIRDLRRQVRYNLIPAQREPDIIGVRGGRKPGKMLESGVDYIADFVYTDAKSGETVVEDVKGGYVRTKDYVIKRKLMLWVHGVRVKEV